jgi:hypothetical protein
MTQTFNLERVGPNQPTYEPGTVSVGYLRFGSEHVEAFTSKRKHGPGCAKQVGDPEEKQDSWRIGEGDKRTATKKEEAPVDGRCDEGLELAFGAGP